MSELFPRSDETGETLRIDGTTIVAYQYDGERYCVECAKAHPEIDVERFHKDPYSVPFGGSVLPRHIREYNQLPENDDHRAHCGNPDCGVALPER